MDHYSQLYLLNIQQYTFYENMFLSDHRGESSTLNILLAYKYLFQEEKTIVYLLGFGYQTVIKDHCENDSHFRFDLHFSIKLP